MGGAATRKQLEVPGTERETIEELDEIAGPYCAALYKRMALQQEEAKLKQQLLDRMEALDEKEYVYQDGDVGYTLKVTSKKKLSCKRAGDADEGDDE